MAMLNSVGGFLLHLCENISDNLWRFAGRARGVGEVNSNVGKLWPGQGVVEVVLAKVVFWKIRDVR